MYALKTDECKEMEAKLHQEQMESIFQRDMLQYLIYDKVDVAVDHGLIWQGSSSSCISISRVARGWLHLAAQCGF